MTEPDLQRVLYDELFTCMQGLPPWIAAPDDLQIGQRNMALVNAITDFLADTITQVASPGFENSEAIVDYAAGRLVRRVVSGRCVGRG